MTATLRCFSAGRTEIVQCPTLLGKHSGGRWLSNRLPWMSNRLRGEFVSVNVAQQINPSIFMKIKDFN
ncbi:hypothetical protein FBY13_101104 [Pantoea sp. SJZ147]|nr:hypothetical protein FBY13_101104 [Pantoea sp. SJZ147]